MITQAKPKRIRQKEGAAILTLMREGKGPLINYDKLLNVLAALNYKNKAQKIQSMRLTSIEERGEKFFDSNEITPHVKDRLYSRPMRSVAMNSAPQAETIAPVVDDFSPIIDVIAKHRGISSQELKHKIFTDWLASLIGK